MPGKAVAKPELTCRSEEPQTRIPTLDLTVLETSILGMPSAIN